MPLSQGEVLSGRYRIVKLLGQGGFGAVYRAWDINLSRPCAVKENLDASSVAQAQFEREARILANLSHPHLARVIDYFFIPGRGQYLVMDYVEGEDLQEMLDRAGGPLPEIQVLPWIVQICDALTYLHSRKPPIIHRDIKPANIKINPQGVAILVDFGIAKIFDPHLRTTVGARAVTPGFSPFEQYGKAPTDNRTDIYALGATFYALLTGQEPTESISRVAGAPLPSLSELNLSVSLPIERAVLQAMEIMPPNRYQSAADFKNALLASATSQSARVSAPRLPPISPTVSAPAVPLPRGTPLPGRKINPAVWLVPLALVAIIALVAGLQLANKKPSVTPPTLPAAATQETITQSLPTRAPTVTEPPVPFEPLSVSALDCGAYPGLFKTIEAVDRFTIRFVMCRPDPAFPSKIAFTAFGIQPREWLEKTGGGGLGSLLFEKPVGTGPYLVQEWRRGEYLALKRFDGYWGEKARMPFLIFKWQADSFARFIMLQSGEANAMDNVRQDDFKTVESNPDLALLIRPAFNIFYIGMNNTYPPFDNEKVRQAIAMAIDRGRILGNFLPPGSEVASHFTPCSIPNGCVGEPWYPYDPATARALLAEAGYPNGFKTELAFRDVVRGYLPQPGVVAQDIQGQLKANLNIDVTINVMDSGAYLQAADAGELKGLHLMGWSADYPDMTDFLDFHFGSSASSQFGNKWPDITEALQRAASMVGDEARKPYYEVANNAIKLHVPMIPVSHSGSAVVYRKEVQNPQVSPLSNETFAGVFIPGKDTFTWVQSAEPMSLYCADETDGDSLRACAQIVENLLSYELGGMVVKPGLAESCTSKAELTEWICRLRRGVRFHDGSDLDANDVVMSFLVQWDAANPLHTGNSGVFEYFQALWGGFLNQP